MKRNNRVGIALDDAFIISIHESSRGSTKRLPRTRSEVKAANKRLPRTRSEVKAAKQSGEYITSSPPLVSSPSSKPQVETHESTKSPDGCFCDICMETKSKSQIFQNTNVCNHLFCSDCIGKHIDAKIQENVTIITCPDPKCEGEIVPAVCQTIVSKEVLDQWDKALSISMITGAEKFNCPYKDCPEMLVENSEESMTSSKCPSCNQLYCAFCKVAWHSRMDCKEYQSLMKKNDEIYQNDNLLIELAKKNKWKRCPKCGFYIARTSGCSTMHCRCGCGFCYSCGKKHYSTSDPCSCRSA